MGIIDFLKQTTGLGSEKVELGIALGGGGARGFAHLGVIQSLYDHGLAPDIISGTSAGSLAGVFIASGKTPRETLDILKQNDMFKYTTIQWPSDGLLSLSGLKKLLNKHIEFTNIEDLQTPLIITVSNLNTGQAEYRTKGPLIDTVLASSSIPVVFKPVLMNGEKFADGGILDNLPIKPLVNRCEKLIAVSISPVRKVDELSNLFQIATRTFQLSVNSRIDGLREKCSLFIEPEGIRKFDLFDIKKADEMFEIGYECMSENISQL